MTGNYPLQLKTNVTHGKNTKKNTKIKNNLYSEQSPLITVLNFDSVRLTFFEPHISTSETSAFAIDSLHVSEFAPKCFQTFLPRHGLILSLKWEIDNKVKSSFTQSRIFEIADDSFFGIEKSKVFKSRCVIFNKINGSIL
ncbi:hypothetical protein BpHYR1_046492 [Brachionus plicatilis]|uniref:Uncharacterized protein n=1 Tax=Brachionus plicatilis TaxID=10195 RepID=A0A3M7PUP8_BRAPC|nr:hypothetical protein BpHYR1_046492 [Brachionus plicatilis]